MVCFQLEADILLLWCVLSDYHGNSGVSISFFIFETKRGETFSQMQIFTFVIFGIALVLKLFILYRSYCQAQFQLAVSVQVQLITEISLIISVRPHPPYPGKYI